MTQYEAIFQRRSIRKFQMKPIDANIMEQINHYMQSVSPLHPEASYRIAVVETNEGERSSMKKRFQTEAPYYLVLSAKEHPYAAKNAGFVMEQIVLYLTAKGIATCYLDEGKPQKTSDHYRTILAVAFGRPAGSLYAPRAKRRPLSELVYYKEAVSVPLRRVLEAGRAAPSEKNRQPWRFVAYANRIHIFMKKTGFLLPRERELREISMGIVMTNLALASEEQWLNWKLLPLDDVAEREMKGYEYVATLMLSEQEFPQG